MKCILITMIALVTLAANAQTQQELTPLERKQQTVLQEPATLYRGFFRIFIGNTYSRLDKFIDDKGNRMYFGNANGFTFSTNTSLLYGISDRFTLSISVPYEYYSFSGNYRVESALLRQVQERSYDRKGGGLADLQLGAFYQLVTETPARPSLRASADITFPTAGKNPTQVTGPDEYKEPLGDGQYKLYMELQARKILYPYTFSVLGYYQFQSDGEKQPGPDSEALPFRGGDLWGLMASAGLHMNDWLTVNGDLRYVGTTTPYFEALEEKSVKSTALLLIPNLTFQVNRFRIFQSISAILYGKNFATNPSYNFGLGYTF